LFMKRDGLRDKIIGLVNEIPDEDLRDAEELLRSYLTHRDSLIVIEPFDRDRARPEFVKELDEAKENARKGEVISHEEMRREIFGIRYSRDCNMECIISVFLRNNSLSHIDIGQYLCFQINFTNSEIRVLYQIHHLISLHLRGPADFFDHCKGRESFIFSCFDFLKERFSRFSVCRNIIGKVRIEYRGFRVADYLNDKNDIYNAIENWERLSRGNYYGYSIYIHEVMELEKYEELIRTRKMKNLYGDTRREEILIEGHGRSLTEQYSALKEYLVSHGHKIKSISQLCYCDIWDAEGAYDVDNTNFLLKYLKKRDPEWHNKEVIMAMNPDEELRALMVKIRSEGIGEK
jgi:hypothetical protein